MSSGWGPKLQAKLDALSNASSKESCQALAKWIGFNRKHLVAHFAPVLVQSLRSEKQPVTLNVLHELLMMDRDNSSKWDKLGDVRLSVVEQVLLPSVPHLSQNSKDRLKAWLQNEWIEAGALGERPTLVEQLRRSLSSTEAATEKNDDDNSPGKNGKDGPDEPPADPAATTKSSSAPTPPSSEQQVAAPASSAASAAEGASPAKAPVKDNQATSDNRAALPAPSKSSTAAAAPGVVATTTSPKRPDPASSRSESTTATAAPAPPFDFESRGIPKADVDPDELMRHSRQIATLQIGRDLRNDSAVQLSSLLSSLPSDVRALLQQPEEGEDNNKPLVLDDDMAKDYSRRINPALLDMDLDEQLQDVLHFRELVMKQRHERTKLIELLVASRCNFGANEAAEAFGKADRSMGQLVERRQVLLDAMELEGLDITAEEAAAKEVKLDELPPLAWYRPEANEPNDEEPDAKRPKTSD